jgi:hypothetical protein
MSKNGRAAIKRNDGRQKQYYRKQKWQKKDAKCEVKNELTTPFVKRIVRDYADIFVSVSYKVFKNIVSQGIAPPERIENVMIFSQYASDKSSGGFYFDSLTQVPNKYRIT